jgi:hypothetical protein
MSDRSAVVKFVSVEFEDNDNALWDLSVGFHVEPGREEITFGPNAAPAEPSELVIDSIQYSTSNKWVDAHFDEDEEERLHKLVLEELEAENV